MRTALPPRDRGNKQAIMKFEMGELRLTPWYVEESLHDSYNICSFLGAKRRRNGGIEWRSERGELRK